MTTLPMPLPRRLIGIGLVLVLHIAMVGALLMTFRSGTLLTLAQQTETIWILPKPVPPPAAAPRHKPGPVAPAATEQAIPDYRGITLPPSPAPTASGGLARSLFGCSEHDLEAMSEEERARCAGALFGQHPDNSVDFRDGSGRAREAARWARGLARKNGPLLLPCMSPQSPNPFYTLGCVGKAAAEGFDPESQPSYGDTPAPEQHIPNGGDFPNGPPQ